MNIKATSGKIGAIIFKFAPLYLIMMLSLLIIVSAVLWAEDNDFNYLMQAFLAAAGLFATLAMLKAFQLKTLKKFKRLIIFTSLCLAPAVVLYFTSDIWVRFSALFISACLGFILYTEISCFKDISLSMTRAQLRKSIVITSLCLLAPIASWFVVSNDMGISYVFFVAASLAFVLSVEVFCLLGMRVIYLLGMRLKQTKNSR